MFKRLHIRSPVVPGLLLAVFAVVIGLTIAVGATAATNTHSAVLANSVAYQDSTGEDPNSLDIGAVTVSNDDTGLVTFDTKFVNGSITPATDFYVVMNTDRDESTGSPNTGGGDWSIGWAGIPVLLKWNGSDWDWPPSMKTLVTMVQPNGLIVKINTSELGNVKGFDFYVKTYRPDPTDPEGQYSDWAPDWDFWGYDVVVYVAPVLTATPVKCTPDPPRAGKPMVASTTVTVTRGTATEQLGTSAKVKATATIGGKTIAGTVLPMSAAGKVSARWLVPKTAKRKVMRGSITVTLENVSVTKAFVDKVK